MALDDTGNPGIQRCPGGVMGGPGLGHQRKRNGMALEVMDGTP